MMEVKLLLPDKLVGDDGIARIMIIFVEQGFPNFSFLFFSSHFVCLCLAVPNMDLFNNDDIKTDI